MTQSILGRSPFQKFTCPAMDLKQPVADNGGLFSRKKVWLHFLRKSELVEVGELLLQKGPILILIKEYNITPSGRLDLPSFLGTLHKGSTIRRQLLNIFVSGLFPLLGTVQHQRKNTAYRRSLSWSMVSNFGSVHSTFIHPSNDRHQNRPVRSVQSTASLSYSLSLCLPGLGTDPHVHKSGNR